MVHSGNQGGNPVMSKPGLETKAAYMCYSDLGGSLDMYKKQEHDFGGASVDIDKIPTDIIKEKIKLTLMGVDKDVIQMHIDRQKREYDEQMALAR